MSCDQLESPERLVLARRPAARTEPRVGDGTDGVIGHGSGGVRTGVRGTAASFFPRQRTDDAGRRPEPGHRVRKGTRYLLTAFAVFTLLAVNDLLLLGGNTEKFFAWTISSRPNTSFLGAAYAAGFVLSVLALRQRQWSRIRVAVITVTAFTVLTLIPTLHHLHRLHLMAGAVLPRSAAWFWLAVYLLVPAACVVVVVRQERRHSRPDRRLDRMPAWLVAILLTQGVALAAAGAILWTGGAGMHASMEMMRAPWPWPVTPLTSMVMGAWLLSFGFAIGLAVRERDLSRMLVPAVAYAAFGLFELVVLVTFRTTPGTDIRWLSIDIAVLATLVATGAYGWWRARRAARVAVEDGDVAAGPHGRALPEGAAAAAVQQEDDAA
jgi:hypothetical protein